MTTEKLEVLTIDGKLTLLKKELLRKANFGACRFLLAIQGDDIVMSAIRTHRLVRCRLKATTLTKESVGRIANRILDELRRVNG